MEIVYSIFGIIACLSIIKLSIQKEKKEYDTIIKNIQKEMDKINNINS